MYVDVACCHRPGNFVCRSVGPSVCHTRELCKNCRTNRDAVWVEDLCGPREPCIRWGCRSPYWKGQFWGGKGRPIVKYRDTLCENGWAYWDAMWVMGSDWPEQSSTRWGPWSPCRKGKVKYRNAVLCAVPWRCRLEFGIGGLKEACITWGCTLAPPSEYHGTVPCVVAVRPVVKLLGLLVTFGMEAV